MSGAPIDETGMLERDRAGFLLRRDQGGIWRLNLHRVPVDHVGKRVRVIGVQVGDDLVDAEGISGIAAF